MRLLHGRRRFTRTTTSVLMLASVAAVGVVADAPAAYALCTGSGASTVCLPPPTVGQIPGPADKTFQPATVLISLAGQVLPQAAAQAATLTSLDQYAAGNTDGGVIQDGIKIANWVPGFKLGFKAGGYIADWAGLGEPDPAYTPYSGEGIAPDSNGWVGKAWPFAGTLNNGTVYSDLRPVITDAKLPYNGQVVQGTGTASPVLENVSIDTYAGFVMPTTTAYLFCRNSAGTVSASGYLGVPVAGSGSYNNLTAAGKYLIGMNSSSNQGQCPAGSGIDHLEVRMAIGEQTGKVAGAWYPAGAPGRPATPDQQPNRSWKMRAICKQSDGTTFNNDTISNTFKETTSTNYPKPPTPVCLAGTLVGWRLILTNESPPYNDIKTIKTWDMPPAMQQNLNSQPLCATNATCGTTLWHVRPTSNETVDCFTVGFECADWATDPNRSTNYRCTYGPGKSADTDKQLALSECYQYGPTFNPGKRSKGVKYGDPHTDPNPATDPSPSTRPGGATAPQPVNAPLPTTGGTTPAPNPDGSPGGTGAPSTGSGCNWADAISFNPVDWVVVPLKCLFIPDPAKVTQSMQDTWAVVSTRPPASVIVPMVSFVQGIGTALFGDCVNGRIANFGNNLIIPCIPPPAIKTYIDLFKLVVSVILFGITAFALWSMLEQSTS